MLYGTQLVGCKLVTLPVLASAVTGRYIPKPAENDVTCHTPSLRGSLAAVTLLANPAPKGRALCHTETAQASKIFLHLHFLILLQEYLTKTF